MRTPTQTNTPENNSTDYIGLSESVLSLLGDTLTIGNHEDPIPAPSVNELMDRPWYIKGEFELAKAPEVQLPDSPLLVYAKNADEVRYVFEDEHDALVDVIATLPPSCKAALEDLSVVITGNTETQELTVDIEGINNDDIQDSRLIYLAKTLIQKAINDMDYVCPKMYDRETGETEHTITLVHVDFGAEGPIENHLFG